MKILVTGAAGFIGRRVAEILLARGDEVVGVDNLNDYYDPRLKEARLETLRPYPGFRFRRLDLADGEHCAALFSEGFERVVHLAAQAGVRYSLINPQAYIQSNLVGFANVLEGCRHNGIEHLVYASSSSVYGANTKMPFSVRDAVDHPVSLYAATKKANELMAHSYSQLYGLPTTGLRFFTVYGPWGRPDMAPFLFTKAILEHKPIDVYNSGDMARDFTYIDDIVEGVLLAMEHIPRAGLLPQAVPASEGAPAEAAPAAIYNIGHGAPVKLLEFIHILEEELGEKARMNLLPMQAGDVASTWADCGRLARDTGYRSRISLREGIRRFAAWYREFYDL